MAHIRLAFRCARLHANEESITSVCVRFVTGFFAQVDLLDSQWLANGLVRKRHARFRRTNRFARQIVARKWTCAKSSRLRPAHKSVCSTAIVSQMDLCEAVGRNSVAQARFLDSQWRANGLVRSGRFLCMWKRQSACVAQQISRFGLQNGIKRE